MLSLVVKKHNWLNRILHHSKISYTQVGLSDWYFSTCFIIYLYMMIYPRFMLFICYFFKKNLLISYNFFSFSLPTLPWLFDWLHASWKQVGMRLLEVNGNSLLGATHQDAVNVLRTAGNEIHLVVCKGYDKSNLIHSIGTAGGMSTGFSRHGKFDCCIV